MKGMEDLRDRLCDELMEVAEQEMTPSTLEVIDKLTHSIKSIDTIVAMEESGYSNERGYSRYDGSYNRGSYARGRGSYVRRDSRGRYSNRMMDEGEM